MKYDGKSKRLVTERLPVYVPRI